jgi:membrane protease YdiL (CAAX protease family)
VVSPILIWAWRHYAPLTGPKNNLISVVWGFLYGMLGMVIWILLLRPFVDSNTVGLTNLAFYLRLFAASLLVPIFEELLMRGYIFRFVYQWNQQRRINKDKAFDIVLNDQSINHFKAGAWSVPAVLVSTAAFTLGHQMHEWPAAFFYGLLMVLLWIQRKDLISCIVAHGTTNFALGWYAYFAKQWHLW